MNRTRSIKLKSTFLLLILIFNLFSPYVLQAGNSKGGSKSGDGPVASAADNFVDKFTGDFNYNVPLMVVPGPNGEAVDISVSYHSGIRMNEPASWLGLGWDYNPGEITCVANGVNDDANGKTVSSGVFRDLNNQYDNNSFLKSAVFGPVYYSNFKNTNYILGNNNKSYDISILNSANGYNPGAMAEYKCPAYDKFYVSGPDIGGKIRPYLVKLTNATAGVVPLSTNVTWSTVDGSTYATPEFIFEKSTAYNYPSSYQSQGNYYDATNHKLNQGTYVKYYFNKNIASSVFSNTTHSGFLDYTASAISNRSTASFDADGIGGFEITKPNGITYHYSLPVYNSDEVNISFALGNTITGNLLQPDLNKRIIHTRQQFLSPNSWKLTAITGSDYQDANNNHVADEGDTGYWIAYNYSLWNNSFNWAFPFFNYTEDADNSDAPLESSYYRPSYDNALAPLMSGIYERKGGCSRGTSQIYYLNSIKTATHTAFFVKDLRLDEHSYDQVLSSSNKPQPKLKLSKIILIRNEDEALFLNTTSTPFTTDNRFDFSNCQTNPTNFIHSGVYNNNKTAIDLKTLKSVSFNSDYSLCPQLHNNINNTFTGQSDCNFPTTRLSTEVNEFTLLNTIARIFKAYDNFVGNTFTTSDATNSGRLTLKEIVTSETGNTTIFPSYKFDYGTNNPAFNSSKIDYFGFYNPNYQPGYAHYGGNSTGEWCLKQITTPLGAQINVNYTSDFYSSIVGSDYPKRIYILNSAQKGSCTNVYNKIYIPTSCEFNFQELDFPAQAQGGYVYFLNKVKCTSVPTFSTIPFSSQVYSMGATSPNANTYNFNWINNPLADFYNLGCANTNHDPVYDCQTQLANPNTEYDNYLPDRYGPGYAMFVKQTEYMGGSAVSSIVFSDPITGQNYTNNYTYQSGVSSTNPDRAIIFRNGANTSTPLNNVVKNTISSDPFSEPPMVGYQKVTVTSSDNSGKQNGYTVYEFNASGTVASSYIGGNGHSVEKGQAYDGDIDICRCCGPTGSIYYPYNLYDLALVKHDDNMGLNGKLNKVTFFDNNNNVIAYTKYNYVSSNLIAESYGREDYFTNPNYVLNVCPNIGTVPYDNCVNSNSSCMTGPFGASYNNLDLGFSKSYDHYIYYTNFEDYTIFLSSTETYKDGITTKQSILGRDPYTGAPTQVLVEDPGQGGLLTNTQYAYSQSVNSQMGLKASSILNENDLMSVSQSTTVKYPMVYDAHGVKSADRTKPGILIGGSKSSFTNNIPYRGYDNAISYFVNANITKPFWKPYQTYQLVVDANTLETQSNLTWRQTSTATAYNPNTQILQESQGLNSRFIGGVKFGHNNQFKVAETSDANLNCFAFSSFEDGALFNSGGQSYKILYGGDIFDNTSSTMQTWPYTHINANSYSVLTPLINGSTVVNAHTGNNVIQISNQNGGGGPIFATKNFDIGRTYKASVWVHSSSPNTCLLNASLDGMVNGVPTYVYKNVAKNDPSNITVGNWILMTVLIDVPINYVASNGSANLNDLRFYLSNSNSSSLAFFDDLSIHPIDAPITGYVYNPITGWLLSTLDNDNFSTSYNYDQAGRVISVYKETKNGVKKISEASYNFGRQ